MVYRIVLAILLMLGVTSAARADGSIQVTLRSGDRIVGQLKDDILRFDVKGHVQPFSINDLDEWRVYHLLLVDGTLLTGAHFIDPALELVTVRGVLRVSSSDIIGIAFRPAAAGTVKASAANNLLDSQKESIKTISGISLQFLLIAVGVFSLAGTYLARTPGDVIRPVPALFAVGALILFALSVFAGYFVHGGIIGQLEAQRFSAYGTTVQWMGVIQVVLFLAGAVIFSAVVWSSALRRSVQFRLNAPGARRVIVVGNFNNWGNIADLARYRLHRWPYRRVWSLRIILPPGTHEYLFLVHEEHGLSWKPDPHCLIRRPNPYGGENCVITII